MGVRLRRFLGSHLGKAEQIVGGTPSIGSRYLVGSVIREIEHPGTEACPVSMNSAGQNHAKTTEQ